MLVRSADRGVLELPSPLLPVGGAGAAEDDDGVGAAGAPPSAAGGAGAAVTGGGVLLGVAAAATAAQAQRPGAQQRLLGACPAAGAFEHAQRVHAPAGAAAADDAVAAGFAAVLAATGPLLLPAVSGPFDKHAPMAPLLRRCLRS